LPLDSEENPLWDGLEPQSTERSGFAPDQMVRCENCLRANPPTRTGCLYCASQLPATAASTAIQRPTLRRLEAWEQGFNTILVPEGAAPLAENILTETSRLLRLQTEDVRLVSETGMPLPLARAATRDEASLIERKLGEMSMRVLTIADSDLAVDDSAIRRVHALELTDNMLVAHAYGGVEPQRASWDEVLLIVTGRLFVRQVEVEERKGRKAESEIMDAREVSADESVLDLYLAQARESWRISSSSFNYSCLGSQKSLVAGQNFSTLLEVLRARAHYALYDDSYNRVRRALNVIWPFEQRTESRGWRRGGPGKIRTESVIKSDNELQFTRYSRLRHYLKLNHPEL
jgi:hypothetical protein